jgi:hypothetical protein
VAVLTNSLAAKSRMALRFIVKFAAFADGTTVIPASHNRKTFGPNSFGNNKIRLVFG